MIEPLETRTGLPVVTSNQALLWHAVRACGHRGAIPGLGRLFSRPRPREEGR